MHRFAGGQCLIGDLVCFIDGSFHPICRPGTDEDDYLDLLQRAFYNGYHKGHGLNFEFLTFPDGMIGRCFGPVEGRHHDMNLGRISKLVDLFKPGGPLFGFVGYGDKAYVSLEPYIYHPYFGYMTHLERRFNKEMSSLRVESEHNIGHTYSRAALVQHPMQIGKENPGLVFQAAIFFQNIHTCIYGNQTSQRFVMRPPTLREYLY